MSDPTPAEVVALHGPSTVVHAQLCVSVDESYARALITARRWFDDGFRSLGGVFREAGLAQTPDQLDVMARLSGRVPHAVSAMLGIQLEAGGYHDRDVAYSGEVWENMLLTLGRLPTFVWFHCEANDGGGEPDGPYFDMSMHRVDSGGATWLVLAVGGPSELFGTDAQLDGLAVFLRGQAESANPVHGEISWRKKSYDKSVLETALNVGPAQTLPTGRVALRGYGWVTVVPEEIGERLGGLEAIRDSGGFVEVEHLGAGGFWCRATPRLSDYDQAAAERVFRAFVRVLPPGRPDMWQVYPPNVLAPFDPAATSP